MIPDAVLIAYAAAITAVGAAWGLLLAGCVRLRRRRPPGWATLTAAAACGTAGAFGGVAAMFAIGWDPGDGVGLIFATMLLAVALQAAATVIAAFGARRAWRAAEGWDAAERDR